MNLIHKDNQAELVFVPKIKKRGEVRLVVKDLMGNTVNDTGYIANSFTTYGDEKAWDSIDGMDIGEGGGATTAGMTDLVGPVLTEGTRKNINGGTTWNTPTAPTWEIWSEVAAQFGDGGVHGSWKSGFVSGTIREVGLFRDWTSRTPDMMARQTVPDLPVTVDNTVFVYYRLYMDVPTARTSGQVVIDGITYNTLVGYVGLNETEETFNGIHPSTPGGPSVSSIVAVNHDVLAGLDERWIRSEAEIGNAYTDLDDSTGELADNSVVIDEPNRTVDWTTQFQLSYGNFPVRGVMGVYHGLRNRRLSGYNFGVGCTFTAVDGPNIGEGIPKDNTQWLNINWRLGYGGVIVP